MLRTMSTRFESPALTFEIIARCSVGLARPSHCIAQILLPRRNLVSNVSWTDTAVRLM